jgi:hypothetical protein
MAEEDALDGNLSDWAAEIRLTANGAHFDPIEDVSLDEANDLERLAPEHGRLVLVRSGRPLGATSDAR